MSAEEKIPTVKSDTLLEIEKLEVNFYSERGMSPAVRGVSFEVRKGETVGIVGESGSGKSVTAMAAMGIVPSPGRVDAGTLRWRGRELDARKAKKLRGRSITMIFQDPVTSLNPLVRIGRQITEVLRRHKGMGRKQARERAIELLELVGIPSPGDRLKQYPYELSGGMNQRIMLAIALAPEPELIIADEPTTGLDVTIQAQILELIDQLKQTLGLAIILITHDLGIVAGVCDQVLVMYAGKIVEASRSQDLFEHPCHPYTRGLLESTPRLDHITHRLTFIEGSPPVSLTSLPACAFADRCPRASMKCRTETPALGPHRPDRMVACWHAY